MKQINLQKLQNKLRIKFLKLGVQMLGPETIYFSEDTKIGNKVVIEPYVVFGPKVKIIPLVVGVSEFGTVSSLFDDLVSKTGVYPIVSSDLSHFHPYELACRIDKKTSELIPLCHPLPIDHTATKIVINEKENLLEVFCVVSAVAKTGVEMEAIMGVNAALITIYDLCKIVNPYLEINNVKLLIKEGGKTGIWKNPDGLPSFLNDIF